MKKSLQLVGTSVGLGLGVALSACAAQDSEPMPAWTPAGHGKALVTDDACSPSRIVSSSKDPFSTCATSTQYTVPNLALAPGATTPGGDLGTQSFGDDDGLGLLDVNGPPMRASCNGKVGPGYDTCGVDHKQSCCSVASVPDARPSGYPVAGFDLDVYEVTSGRFESFVAATGGNLRDAAAQGKWPGWKPEWTEQLPASRADVDDQLGPSCKARSALDEYGALTWPADRIVQSVNGYMVDDNERAADIRADATPDRLHQKPINCVTYYVAAAFCAWDGGRLPTNTEWGYVAQGGAEKRAYPWGADVTAANAVTDLKPPPDSGFFTFPDGFSYNDLGMNAYHIAPPGSKPAGRGKWGHEDLGGNLLEWTADVVGTSGLVRGGSWEGHSMSNAVAFANYPLDRSYGSLGIRCAYGAAPAASVALPEPTTTVSVYRAHDAANDAYQQGAQVDLAAPGYELQGMSFRVQVPTVAAPNSYPLHRCLVPGSRDYFLSNDPACEGQQHLGLLGYAYADQQLGTLPLYRCYGGKGTHLSTVTPVECTEEGLQLEGLQGYVVPPPPGTFVRNTYKTALAREPENDGYVAWMNGFPRQRLQRRVARGVQHRGAPVARVRELRARQHRARQAPVSGRARARSRLRWAHVLRRPARCRHHQLARPRDLVRHRARSHGAGAQALRERARRRHGWAGPGRRQRRLLRQAGRRLVLQRRESGCGLPLHGQLVRGCCRMCRGSDLPARRREGEDAGRYAALSVGRAWPGNEALHHSGQATA